MKDQYEIVFMLSLGDILRTPQPRILCNILMSLLPDVHDLIGASLLLLRLFLRLQEILEGCVESRHEMANRN